MTNNNPYQSMAEVCQESQRIFDMQIQAVQTGQMYAAVYEPCEKLWKGYFERFPDAKEFEKADFSQMLFIGSHFKEFNFSGSNFQSSKWFLSFVTKCDCSDSDFSGANLLMTPFQDTNLSRSNFSRANLKYFPLFTANDFEDADFSNAEITIELSFLKEDGIPSRTRFDGARMQGSKVIVFKDVNAPDIKAEKAKAILDSFFSPEQLAGMSFDFRIPKAFSLKSLFKK
jgi:uncharacterized protein YjbI with pentapeptide repeats